MHHSQVGKKRNLQEHKDKNPKTKKGKPNQKPDKSPRASTDAWWSRDQETAHGKLCQRPTYRGEIAGFLSSERVAREQNKETHLHQSQLEEGTGVSPTFQPSEQDKALLHLKMEGTMAEWGQVFNLPNALIKTKNLQLLAKRKQGTPHQLQNTIEKGQITKSCKTEMYQDPRRKKEREATGHLTDGNRRTSTLSTGTHWKTWSHGENSSQNWKNFCTLDLQVNIRNLVTSEGPRAV